MEWLLFLEFDIVSFDLSPARDNEAACVLALSSLCEMPDAENSHLFIGDAVDQERKAWRRRVHASPEEGQAGVGSGNEPSCRHRDLPHCRRSIVSELGVLNARRDIRWQPFGYDYRTVIGGRMTGDVPLESVSARVSRNQPRLRNGTARETNVAAGELRWRQMRVRRERARKGLRRTGRPWRRPPRRQIDVNAQDLVAGDCCLEARTGHLVEQHEASSSTASRRVTDRQLIPSRSSWR